VIRRLSGVSLVQRAELGDDLVIDWDLLSERPLVWKHLTDRDRLAEWLGDPIAVDMRDGGQLDVDHGGGYMSQSRILEFRPADALSLTWSFPDEHVTALTFILSDAPDGTRLQLTHRGLGTLWASYSIGWLTHLTFLEASAGGAPLPRSQFWRIHQTFQHLGSSPAA
jgi:uncharacterized protein YndB with AHSA1/START domain